MKLAILIVLVLLFSNCIEKKDHGTGKVLTATSYRYDARQLNTAIASAGITSEERNHAFPVEDEEIRKQRNLERVSNTEWIKISTQKHSPLTWNLLMEYDKLPESTDLPTTDDGLAYTRKTAKTFQFLKGRSRIDLLASMEKNIHEIAHAYFDQNVYKYLRDRNQQINTGNAQGYIYISPSKNFFVSFPLKSMFPSGELSGFIPENLRTYRFETYIEGNTSTQSDGIIGLLNELYAYYLGSVYCFDMLEPYKEAAGSDGAGLFEWVTHTQSTMSAFYEFDFFLKEYLLNMNRKHETDYEKLRSYREFSEAYNTLLKLYEGLIDNYLERIRSEMKHLNSSGKAGAEIEKGWLWVKTGNSHVSSGTPIFSIEKETLLPVLESRRYRQIEKDFPVK